MEKEKSIHCKNCKNETGKETQICLKCGFYLSNNNEKNNSNKNYAGFWIRFLAYMIDFVIILSVFYILLFLNLIVIFTILLPLYFIILESSEFRGTIGKIILNLKVVSLNRERISFLKATLRFFLKSYLLILPIFHLVIAFTNKKQGIHDILLMTLVIKEK